MRRARGFTLIELLIAISIFAIISVMAFGGLQQVLRVRERVDIEREFWRNLSLVFLRMEEDLSQARARPVRDISGVNALHAFVGRPTDLRALAEPSLEFTRGGVQVLNTANVEDDDEDASDLPSLEPVLPRSDLQRVGYRLSEKVLYRLSWAELDRPPYSKPVEVALIEGVEDFQVRFFGVQPRSVAPAWSNLWPPDPAFILAVPHGVEVKIVIAERGEFTRKFMIHD